MPPLSILTYTMLGSFISVVAILNNDQFPELHHEYTKKKRLDYEKNATEHFKRIARFKIDELKIKSKILKELASINTETKNK